MMLILTDTNILLRLVEQKHPQHGIAADAIEIFEARGHQPCIVPQVGYEFWVVATRPKEANGLGMSPAKTQSEFDTLLPPFRVLRDERLIFEIWRRLVLDYSVTGKNAHDARLVAAMLRHGISHLLTFNAPDFARYSEITVIEPEHAGALPSEF
jgi:predicted nucleic acid-binding protein